MERARFLAILASVIHLVAYVVYNTAVLQGSSSPNLVPWLIWGMMAVLNAETYKIATGDKVKAMLAIAGSVAAISTLVVAVFLGGTFRELGAVNAIALVTGFIAIVVWKLGSARIANYCVLVGVVAGFVPFFTTLWSNPHAENWLPWTLWSVSTSMGVLVVALRRENRKKADFVMPGTLALLHPLVLVLILRGL